MSKSDVDVKFVAVQDVLSGSSILDVANKLGVHPDTIRKWKKLYDKGGAAALASKKIGRPSIDRASLRDALDKGRQSGEVGSDWTINQILDWLRATGFSISKASLQGKLRSWDMRTPIQSMYR